MRAIQKVAAQKQAAKATAAKQAKTSTNSAPTATSNTTTSKTSNTAKDNDGAKKAPGGKVRNPYLFEKLEQRIMTLEQELAQLQASTTTEEVYRNGTKLRDVQMRMAEIERDLTQANEEWERWIG